MSEEEKDQHLLAIDGVITSRLNTFYWIFGILVCIMIGTSGYLFSKSSEHSVEISKLQINKIDSEEVYRKFLEKRQYHLLQKDARKVDLEADKNPQWAPYMIEQLNSKEVDELNLIYRQGDYKK